MQVRRLAVEGALEFTPRVYADERGTFVSPYQEPAFLEAVGRPLFPVAQTSISRSGRGVIRGLHYTATPPGSAKYVYCARGRVLDMVVDIRVGSPTFGRWDSAVLDGDSFRGIYLPVGVGHGFVALEDESLTCYLLSGSYIPQAELALSALDPALSLPIPAEITPVLSQRDRAAPTLAEAEAAGLLPEYGRCTDIEARLAAVADGTPTTA